MREIKFRAWDGESMSDSFTLSKQHTTFDDSKTYRTIALECDRWEIMQFTGLHDKNGTPIYEKDRLHEKYNWVVEFVNGCFIIPGLTKYGFEFTVLHKLIKFREKAGVPIEVCGNIFESPELINRR